jgi:hypothetical protein
MWRICAIVLTAYNYGNPGLESVRPAALDQPLSSFYREMNTALRQATFNARQWSDRVIFVAGNEVTRAKTEVEGYVSAK